MSLICRHCKWPLKKTFLDLGHAPPSNAYLSGDDLQTTELYFPLRLKVCTNCRLVQTEDYAEAEKIFTKDYAYFSSTSKGWLDHARNYSAMIIKRLSLNSDSQVIEVASNDGYLLKNFSGAGIPCLGIEPTSSTAAVARDLGINVKEVFFSTDTAKDLPLADLIIGNNVYAHVPDINDFTKGLEIALKPEGVISLEFPHLMRLVELSQFDTVYHEHFSYLSLTTVSSIMREAGLRVFDVEELPTHGGSLRIYACKIDAKHKERFSVNRLLDDETERGMHKDDFYSEFQTKADTVKNNFLRFLLDARADGRRVAAYGAAAKGNTLINYAGVKPDLLPYICDSANSKIGKFMPGSHIPILSPEVLRIDPPDDLIILPWNIADEIKLQLADLAVSGTRFVTFVPSLKVIT